MFYSFKVAIGLALEPVELGDIGLMLRQRLGFTPIHNLSSVARLFISI